MVWCRIVACAVCCAVIFLRFHDDGDPAVWSGVQSPPHLPDKEEKEEDRQGLPLPLRRRCSR